jgi:uncharacterized membrane protein (GlpM family)
VADQDEPLFGVHLGALGDLPIKDIAIRFAFGATISAIAGVVAVLAGSEPSGLMLAFPAILPATLTLVEKDEGERQAEDLDVGAIFGAAALGVFAVVVWQFMPTGNAVVVLALATAAWLGSAVLLYLGFRLGVARGGPLHRGIGELAADKTPQ